MGKLKSIVKAIPVVGPALQRLYAAVTPNSGFPGSQRYWEQRYSEGGTSGSGSYNRLAEFKANVLNSFVRENSILSVVELGCGDGNQLALYAFPQYTGLDVSPTAVEMCSSKFSEDGSKDFAVYDGLSECQWRAEMAISIDVIFHLVEDEVFARYMTNLFEAASRYVVVYSSNRDTDPRHHERDHAFSDWIEKNQPDWMLLNVVENDFKFDPEDSDNTSRADFYFYAKRS